MNLHDIRTNRATVDWWQAVMAHPNFKAIWKMMNDTHPLRMVPTIPTTTTDDSNKRLGTIEGYELCIRRLELCAILDEKLTPLPDPSFEPLQQEESNESPS